MPWVTGAVDETVPDVLLDAPAHLSVSQVNNLAPEITGSAFGCPRKFGYERLMGLPFVGGPMLYVGTCVDRALAAYLSSRMAGWDDDLATRAAATVASSSIEEVGLEEPYHRVVGEAVDLLVRHRRPLPVPAAVQSRHVYSVTVGEHVREVLGFSDWIEQDGTIVDLKMVGSEFGRNADDPAWITEKTFQLASYYAARLAAQRRGEPTDAPVVPQGRLVVCYHKAQLKTPQLRIVDVPITEEDVGRVLAGVRVADVRSRTQVLPARPGKGCLTCSHNERCRADSLAQMQTFSEVTHIPRAVA